MSQPPMDQRTFGPYYGTPPEARDPEETRTEQALPQPIRPTRARRRLRLLAGRRRTNRP